MLKNNWLFLFTMALFMGVVVGVIGWLWFSFYQPKVPESATQVMHNILFFGEFL